MSNTLSGKEETLSLSTKGGLIVITGPSGVGKDSLAKGIRNKYPHIIPSVSVTTRPPRKGEEEGIHYYFVSKASFKWLISSNQLLEWAEYGGNLYGTPRDPLEMDIEDGHITIAVLDIVGAISVKQVMPSAVSVFIMPPGLRVLEERIRNRNLDSEESIRERMNKARVEIEQASKCDYVVINGEFEVALRELENIISKELL